MRIKTGYGRVKTNQCLLFRSSSVDVKYVAVYINPGVNKRQKHWVLSDVRLVKLLRHGALILQVVLYFLGHLSRYAHIHLARTHKLKTYFLRISSTFFSSFVRGPSINSSKSSAISLKYFITSFKFHNNIYKISHNSQKKKKKKYPLSKNKTFFTKRF